MADDSTHNWTLDSSLVPSITQNPPLDITAPTPPNTSVNESPLENPSGDTTQGANPLDLSIESSSPGDSSPMQLDNADAPESSNADPPAPAITEDPLAQLAKINEPLQTADELKASKKQARKEAKEKEKERKKLEADRIQVEAMKRLGEQLKLNHLAICVGPGVTTFSAPKQAERLSWRGLMNNALDFFEDQASTLSQQPINRADLNAARKMLQQSDLTEADREGVVNRIQKLLANRADLETAWMRAQFKNLYEDYVDNVGILDAIKALHQNGALIFTTNYDDLLERHCGLDPIDAADPDGLSSWRRGSRQAVFHPHGYWRNADHIVLSADQYWRDKRDTTVQETLQYVLDSRTVLFIGCGSGLSDPNFEPLIRWIGKKNAVTSDSHYILLQTGEKSPVTQLPLVRLRSESFEAVPGFLQALLPQRQPREGILSELPDDRERKRIHEWLRPIDQSQFLNDMTNLEGPNRFDRQVTKSADVWAMNYPSRVIVTGDEGWGKTMFCTSVIQHTLKSCQLGMMKRTRDSLAYFYCATYQPYLENPDIQMHDLNTFLRTVISQLTPPDVVFEPLRKLYAKCTRYHPARLPTDAELTEALIGILWILEKPTTPKNGDAVEPGKTYLVIDELGTLTPNMKDQYSKFIRLLNSERFQHFHLLVAADSPATVGVPPPPRPRRLAPPKKGGKGGDKGKGKNIPKSLFSSVPQTPKVNTSGWATITLDWASVSTAMLEWLRHSFAHNPSLATFGKLGDNLVYRLYEQAQNFRWVYWKLDQLGQLGATAGNSTDDELGQVAADVITEDSDGEEDSDDDDDNEGGKGVGDDPSFDPDDDDDDEDVLPSGKRSKKQMNPAKKKVKFGAIKLI
ncbi:SIR2-like domain-containing protein [Xylaria telfairii]|nr:SIR2-like domain-containing protein [Xylaria telfairii]